ncbi:MAG: class I adenylate-forming enzyme family protein [Bacilli bacterium]|nr:class I adenylate-forming enzyme family protein [Bacilli bacterium]MDD4808517.1 class I adenylate-forming enzyme family protein [Bacilli bacterium]
MRKLKSPWMKYYNVKKNEIEVPNLSMYDVLKEVVVENPFAPAYNYYGTVVSYRRFLRQIDRACEAFKRHGVKFGDTVTICLPNFPEGIICVYALNKMGAIANMVHPLSGEEEIKKYLNNANSKIIVTLDFNKKKIKNIIEDTKLQYVIIVDADNSLKMHLKFGYKLQNKTLFNEEKLVAPFIKFKKFLVNNPGSRVEEIEPKDIVSDRDAIIIHSGGTTGTPKDIVLTNGNFNALTIQCRQLFSYFKKGDKVLTIMPIFHGFGLGISAHCIYALCGETILVPKFEAKKADNLIKKYRPNILVGVPTLYEALLNNKGFKKVDLSFVENVISGGDILTESLKNRVNEFLKEHNSTAVIEQGYGLSEAVAATSFASKNLGAPCSIGIPLPGNYYKIVEEGSEKEVPYNYDGEICVYGPTIMKGYLNQEEETKRVLRKHKDGRIWLHTGDVGSMSKDGIVTYKLRYKRMIVSSGYNIYPQHIENIINSHESVAKCCVVGAPHKYKMEVAKAFIVLKDEQKPTLKIKKEIDNLCRKNLPKFSIPAKYIFKDEFPTTLVGKVDYRVLQDEAKDE